MNQKVLIALIALLGIGGVGFFILRPTTTEPMTSDEPAVETNDDSLADAGRYIEYQDGVLEANTSSRRVLFFYANWCPTCRPADADFKKNENQIPKDVIIIRVNYNDSATDQEEESLANRYNITYQHTFVQIDETGQEVTRWNGGDFSELLSRLK